MRTLVTGGAGYFGELLAGHLIAEGHQVRVLDLNPPESRDVEAVCADIRDVDAVLDACRGIDAVYHNVAQVPLAKDRGMFWSVNCDGTRILLDAARRSGVAKVVHTSSSAVFGIPKELPVTEETRPMTVEDYGQAKLAGEELCRAANSEGLDVSIIRPRTILGPGRLGIVQILFDWVEKGHDLPVFDGGHNTYQFVHADDLARACMVAGSRPGFGIYNIGSARFGTMRRLLEALILHAGSTSRIKSLPMAPMTLAMQIADKMGLSPLGPYHALMYGREMYFDISKARRELGYEPASTDWEAICQSYDWYLSHRDSIGAHGASHHKSPVRKGLLSLVPALLGMLPS